MNDEKVPFCLNSNRYIDFMWHVPKACPEDSWMDCDGCSYCEMRQPSQWYKRKMKILKSYSQKDE